MKITTGGTGMVSSQSSMTASVLQQAIAALNYNYTWAADFSKFGANVNDSFSAISAWTVTKTTDGVKFARNNTTADSSGFQLIEGNMPSDGHSYGSIGAEFPENSIPDALDSSGYPPEDSPAIGHPGRYVSVVASFDRYDIDPTPAGTHDPDDCRFNLIGFTGSGTALYYWMSNTGFIGSSHLNGVADSDPSNQTEWDSIVGAGPQIFTFDCQNVYVVIDVTNNPYQFNFYAAYQRKINYEMILHGMIFSDVPPEPITLPVEITNPTIGSGPA